MRPYLVIAVFLLLSGFSFKVSGRDTLLFRDITHRLSAEVRPAYNIPTHGFYRGYNTLDKPIKVAGSAHIKYGFSFNPNSHYGRIYPSAYQGIGLAVHSFFNHELTGTPFILYLFQGSRIADFGEKISLDFEWNLGASYGWKVNEVVGSRFNIYINIGLPLTWHLSPQWDISIAPEYTHFSNGDTRFPNGGANTVGCRIGITGKIKAPAKEKAPGRLFIEAENELKEKKFSKRISYDICIYGGWRADRYTEGNILHIVNKPFFTAGLNFNPLYRFNRYFSAGAAIDLMMDKSSGEAFGLSARCELTMPIFSINLGAGYNILSNTNELKGFYTTFNLKAFVSRKIFLNIGYRLSSVLYSHNLMFGAGVRL